MDAHYTMPYQDDATENRVPLFTSTDGSCSLRNRNVVNGNSPTKIAFSPVPQNHKTSHHFGRRCIGSLCRVICLDIPLVLLLSLYAITVHMEWIGHNYVIPLVQLQKFDNPKQSLTYYHRVCTKDDQTTDDATDLLVNVTNIRGNRDVIDRAGKIDRAVEKMQYHGVTILPNLISEPTATKLRDYIIEQNTNPNRKDFIGVIENDFRYSFGIQVDEHPIIAIALEEILHQNPDLVAYLEAIMGSDPAVTEFTAISQMYGAVDQHWHEDVVSSGSTAKYGHSFVPTYNLFIPLQNVTAEMGATWVCPGTHMCSESAFCPDTGFQASGQNNNWPLGYGILMNQQLTHRGGGHRDPNGPERVVFMFTFAPRPRVFSQNKIVETRKIGLGGSYSQHILQWGHTLSDFQQPLNYMKQPYRTLRSLGIYNNRDDGRWGWDYVTVCIARRANDDFPCPSAHVWQSDLKQAKVASLKLYQGYMAAYTVIMLLLLFVPRERQCHWPRQLLRHALRLGTIHLLMLCATWLGRRSITDSTWGRNIQAKRSFRISNHTFSPIPSLPATLPERHDILIFEGIQSETDSHVQVLQVAHPGNLSWNTLVRYFAHGYDRLSITLQEQIRRQMFNIVQQQNRRILIQNNQLNWATASHDVRHRFSHKRLLQVSNRNLNHLILSFDGLLSEIRHGYWRDTALYTKHIMQFVTYIQSQYVAKEISRRHPSHVIEDWPSSIRIVPLHGVVPKRTLIQGMHSTSKCGSIPCYISPKKPSTWLNVGDVAEVTFADDDAVEWYRCTISSANSDQNVWNVEYDDGYVQTNICHTCVRPFVPYAVNETIDVMLEPDDYTSCRVKSIHQRLDNNRATDWLYDVQLDDSNITLSKVRTEDLRRNYRNILTRIPIHAPVVVRVLYQDEASHSPTYDDSGVILQYHAGSNSYDVVFDDGEVLYNVSRNLIQLS